MTQPSIAGLPGPLALVLPSGPQVSPLPGTLVSTIPCVGTHTLVPQRPWQTVARGRGGLVAHASCTGVGSRHSSYTMTRPWGKRERPRQSSGHVPRGRERLERHALAVLLAKNGPRTAELATVSTNLGDLLTEVRDLLLPSARTRNVDVAVAADAQPLAASCDAGQLRRALLNLAQNAVQACPADGTGKVRSSCPVRVSQSLTPDGPRDARRLPSGEKAGWEKPSYPLKVTTIRPDCGERRANCPLR